MADSNKAMCRVRLIIIMHIMLMNVSQYIYELLVQKSDILVGYISKTSSSMINIYNHIGRKL